MDKVSDSAWRFRENTSMRMAMPHTTTKCDIICSQNLQSTDTVRSVSSQISLHVSTW